MGEIFIGKGIIKGEEACIISCLSNAESRIMSSFIISFSPLCEDTSTHKSLVGQGRLGSVLDIFYFSQNKVL